MNKNESFRSEVDTEDTIAAISTPIGEGGIAVLRLSGPDAFRIASRITRLRNQNDFSALTSHTIHVGDVSDLSGITVDQVLISVFRKPHSYTGEDVIEISSHGGLGVSRRILSLLIQSGARHAEPGEFTKRAFLNGKLDLPQAEAVLDLIKSKSEKSMQVAAHQLAGRLSVKFKNLKDEIMKIYAHMEAYLDFPDEHLEIYEDQEFMQRLTQVESEISKLISGFERGALIREGAVAVLVGRANVGKSSLFNALLERDHALVSEHPGTTRDRLEESVSLNGVAVRLVDTAGLGLDSDHPLDRLGAERTKQVLTRADLYFYVLDGSEPLTEADRCVFQELDPDTPRLVLVNKSDLPQKIDLTLVEKMAGATKRIAVSTKTREGLDSVEKKFAEIFHTGNIFQAGEQITRLRHKQTLESALQSLRQAIQSYAERKSLELVTFELQDALNTMKELIGEIYSENLLDIIFSEFCIGK